MKSSPRRSRAVPGHWHLCEVCGARGLFWDDTRCDGKDEDHDYGFCRDCRIDIALLCDGTPTGGENVRGYCSVMRLMRKVTAARARKKR